MGENRPRLVIGAGYLGRRLAERWAAAGQKVFAVTRSARKAQALRASGVEPIVVDLSDATAPERLAACGPFDTVVWSVAPDRGSRQASSHPPLEGRGGASVFAPAHADRVGFFERTLRPACARLAGCADRWLHVSSTSVYGQQGGEWIDEDSPPQPRSDAGKAQWLAEQMVCEAFGTSRAVILRLAGLYGPGRLLRRLDTLRGAVPIPGCPDAWLNLIHVDDAVTAIDVVASSGYRGPLLVCDDRPVRRREFFEHLAAAVGAPPPVFDPSRDPERVQGLGKRCRNRRLRTELGVPLRYPTFREGLRHALAEEPPR